MGYALKGSRSEARRRLRPFVYNGYDDLMTLLVFAPDLVIRLLWHALADQSKVNA